MIRWLPDPLPDLDAALANLVAQVPAGRVTTFGALAAALGYPPAARWAGQAVRALSHDREFPWHRVVRVSGELPGTATESPSISPEVLQREVLQLEQVPFDGERVEMASALWTDFRSDRPLEKLVELQREVAELPEPPPLEGDPKLVGAVDCWYPSEGMATAAFAMCEWPNPHIVREQAVQRPIRFPYITGLLSYRELPVLTALLKEVGAQVAPDVVLVDGSGRLHPRRAGIAVQLAAATGLRTIGVTKTRLIGVIDDETVAAGKWSPVRVNGEILGAAVRPASRSRKWLYVSPGRGVDVETAVRIVLPMLSTKKRLPGPIAAADKLSRTFASD